MGQGRARSALHRRVRVHDRMPDGAFHLPRRRASCAPARSGLECGPRRTERRSPIRVLATEHRHGSVERALRFLALGTAALVPLATDADERVTVDVVAAALQASDAPTIVHLDAADPNVGAIDPFAALVPIACAAGALVHVDGAFDLWAPEQPASRQDGRGRVGALLGGGRAQMAQNAQGYRDGGDRRSRSAPGGNDDQRGLHRA